MPSNLRQSPPWRASSDAVAPVSDAGVDVPLGPEWALAYFQERLSDHGALQAVSLERMPRGVSRESWDVRLGWKSGEATRLVVRRDSGGVSVDGIPLDREFAIYERLQGSGVPVAPVLWFEHDARWRPGGRDFYIREWIDGDWRVGDVHDDDPGRDDWRISLSKEHLAALAKVHTLDWRARRFDEILPAPSSPERAALELIERFEARVQAYGFRTFPLASEAIAALKDAAPRDASAICLCKGTNGLGEEIWKDGKIVAMSDWELAIIGDPAYDFCQVQDLVPDIPGRWGWSEALDYYHGLTGIRVDLRRIDFYRAICSVQQLGYALNAGKSVMDRRDDQIRYCWVGSEVLHHAMSRLMETSGHVGSGAD